MTEVPVIMKEWMKEMWHCCLPNLTVLKLDGVQLRQLEVNLKQPSEVLLYTVGIELLEFTGDCVVRSYKWVQKGIVVIIKVITQ